MDTTEKREKTEKSNARRSFAIISGKGGTGKTIIASSVAFVLAHCGFKTLLIDMDFATNGLTFYASSLDKKDIKCTVNSILRAEQELTSKSPVLIPSKFTAENLSVLPAERSAIDGSTENISSIELIEFISRIGSILDISFKELGFDFVLIDTRGGTDKTSISAALACDGYVIVTEADNPSWDMGNVLLEELELNQEKCKDSNSQGIGFVINKNVLPPLDIEKHLRKEWNIPHLATINSDNDIVRFFQLDMVPIAEEIGIEFNGQILKIVRKMIHTEEWPLESIELIERLEFDYQLVAKKKSRAKNLKNRNQVISRVALFTLVILVLFLLFKIILITNELNYNEEELHSVTQEFEQYKKNQE